MLAKERGKILCIDYGTVRMGIAISDGTNTLASGRGYINVVGKWKTLEAIGSILSKNSCTSVVIGLPLSLNGNDTKKTHEVRYFADMVSEYTKAEVILWDERLSSYEADIIMHELKIPLKKRKGKRDELAAQVILQSYLDAVGKR